MTAKTNRLKSVKSKTIEFLWAVLAILGFLCVWHLAVVLTPVGKLMPSPIAVVKSLAASFLTPIGPHTIQVHALYSLKRILVGYFAACILGIIFGLGIGLSKHLNAIFYPIFELIRPIPTVAWIPIAIIWFGTNEMSKYFIVFYGAFSNVVVSVYAGIRGVDPVLIGAAKMLGCTNRQVIFKVILPASVPSVFNGMQVALSAGTMSVVVAEMIKASEGIGWIIHAGQQVADMTEILTGMVALALFGLLLATILRSIERKLCAWNIRNT